MIQEFFILNSTNSELQFCEGKGAYEVLKHRNCVDFIAKYQNTGGIFNEITFFPLP